MIDGKTYISSIIGDRMDVPFRISINDLLDSVNKVHCRCLGDIVHFSSEYWDQETLFEDVFPYIEIGSIDTITGNINNINTVLIKEAPSRAKRIVRRDDILVSTTRPNRGAICLYKNDTISIASTGFSIIREIDENVLRDYLFLVLRLPISLEQMIKRSSGGNYPAIIESELRKVLLPIPSIDIQKEVVKIYLRAQEKRSSKIQEANQLLSNLNNYLFNILQIDNIISASDSKQSLKQNLSSLIGGRFDPQQFHNERIEMINHIKQRNWCRLKDVVNNIKMILSSLPQEGIYLGLENIDGNTGEYVLSNEKESISSAVFFKEGNILFPKLRPYLNKVYRAQFEGCCSTEFHVFEAHDINSDFLTIVLRSNMILAQTRHLMTGNTLPRLQTTDIDNLIIPYPDIKIQEEVVNTIFSIKNKAKRLKEEGNALLEEVKQKIEKLILK